MFEDYNIEDEYKKYSALVEQAIVNRKSLLIFKETLDKLEDNVYTQVHMEIDANGKPLYKNEEARKIAVNEELRKAPTYEAYQTEKQKSIEMELQLEKFKLLLGLLQQEKEFKLKVEVCQK